MTNIVTKAKINRSDIEMYDGKSNTTSRRDSTGGTVSGLKVNDFVDVLQVYGGGANLTRGTIADCVTSIDSTTNVTLHFSRGTWVIDDDLTIGANFTCKVAAGCVFQVASGKTLTFSGWVEVENATWTSGSGTVTVSGTVTFVNAVDIDGTLNVDGQTTLQGATPLIFEGATADAFETSVAVTDPTADRTITIPDQTGTVGLWAKGADIASATTITPGKDGNYFDITGTTNITAIADTWNGRIIKLHFDGALTLSHHATNLVLPFGQDIVTYAGLELEFTQYATGDWRLTGGIDTLSNPSFSVHRNGTSQNNITGIDKVEWTAEEFDTNDDFDNSSNFRYTPTVAGKYLLSASVHFESVTDGDRLEVYLYKNGVSHKKSAVSPGRTIGSTAVGGTVPITAVVDANGSTDYYEIFAQNVDRDTSEITGDTDITYFTGCRIA